MENITINTRVVTVSVAPQPINSLVLSNPIAVNIGGLTVNTLNHTIAVSVLGGGGGGGVGVETDPIAMAYLNQSVKITASPSFVRATLNQSDVAGAVPVLQLTQADISEEFTRFIGSASAGVLTQSIVNNSDANTMTQVGWLKIYVQDDGNQIADGAYFMPFFSVA